MHVKYAVARRGGAAMADEEVRAADILIVDDEVDVAKIIAINLEFDGHHVRIAYNGREALEEVARKAPDCILLDIMMPVMDGWQVLQALKKNPDTAEIPVIVVTARRTDVDHIRGFSGGAVEYITKPFNPEDLKLYVAKALEPRDEIAEEEKKLDRIRRLQLSTLHDITETLISTLEIDEVLEIIAEKLLKLFDLDLCAICLPNSLGYALHLASIRSSMPMSQEDLDVFEVQPERLGEIIDADPLSISGLLAIPASDFTHGALGGAVRRLQSLYLLSLKSKSGFTGLIFLGKEKEFLLGSEEEELLSAIGNQAAIAIENARLYDDLRYDEEVHKQLLQRVISAQESERRRVAVELHDGVIQNMVSALFRLQLCSERMDESPEEVRAALVEAEDIMNDGIVEMRRIVAGLRPLVLDDLGLEIALRKYIRHMLEEAPSPIEVEFAGVEVPPLTQEAETTLFRIAQEALSNILKHSQCERSSLSIAVKGHEIIMIIEDDGIGFEQPGVQHRMVHGFGLVGMRERAESLGGSLEVETSPRVGTTITVRLPLDVVKREV
jgi:signal transduction histidine kinase